jgi:hypothetical protein
MTAGSAWVRLRSRCLPPYPRDGRSIRPSILTRLTFNFDWK